MYETWQHSLRFTIVVYMQIVVPRSPVESFKLWLEQFSFMKEGCDIFFESDLWKKWFAFRRTTLILLKKKKKYARSMHSLEQVRILSSRFLTRSKLEEKKSQKYRIFLSEFSFLFLSLKKYITTSKSFHIAYINFKID